MILSYIIFFFLATFFENLLCLAMTEKNFKMTLLLYKSKRFFRRKKWFLCVKNRQNFGHYSEPVGLAEPQLKATGLRKHLWKRISTKISGGVLNVGFSESKILCRQNESLVTMPYVLEIADHPCMYWMDCIGSRNVFMEWLVTSEATRAKLIAKERAFLPMLCFFASG